MKKTCFVPSCSNNSDRTPHKLFVLVPMDQQRRDRWFAAINQQFTSKTRYVYCCEDHFNMREDAENWMQYKTIGSRLKMKTHVVPHLFLTSFVREQQPGASQLSSSAKKRKFSALQPLGKRVVKTFFQDDLSTQSQLTNSEKKRKAENLERLREHPPKVVQSLFADVKSVESVQPSTSACVKYIHNCNVCPYYTTSSFLMVNHVRAHLSYFEYFNCENGNIETYHCKDCGFQTKLTCVVKQHVEQRHRIKRENEENLANGEYVIQSYVCKKCNFETYFLLKCLQHAAQCWGKQ